MIRLAFFLVFLLASMFAFATTSGEGTIFPKDTSYRIKKVVIDAGHGGKDSGCLGKHSQEKNITLKIALALGRRIKENYPNIDIVYTRDKDIFIPLDERANIANNHRADLFISIHCNFLPANSTHSGSETYVLGLHKTRENLEVAKRENAAVFLEDNYKKRYKGFDFDTPESNILMSALQSSYMERSFFLAELLEKKVKKDLGKTSHGVKQAGFLVLRATSMPSILVETGFLSSKKEEIYLSSPEGQQDEATAIFDAFELYKNTVETGKSYAVENVKKAKKKQESQVVLVEKMSEDSLIIAEEKIIITEKKTAPTVRPKIVKPIKIEEKIVKKQEKMLVFKVQIATSTQKLSINDDRWKLISELEIVEEPTQYIYRADGFDTYESANQLCQKLKQNGFPDAFIVAFDGAKRIDVKTAIEKQKEKN